MIRNGERLKTNEQEGTGMARPRKPERDEAKKLYLQSGGKISAKELAAAVGVDDGRIRKWKSLDTPGWLSRVGTWQRKMALGKSTVT